MARKLTGLHAAAKHDVVVVMELVCTQRSTVRHRQRQWDRKEKQYS